MERVTDRGQLLLAGAFVLAIALIGLTLVLTSGGYTTTLAGQDNAVNRGTDAITVREAVLSDLDRYLRSANSEYADLLSDPPTAPNPEPKFKNVIPELADRYRDQYGRHGRLVEVEAPSSSKIEHGYRVAQPDGESFQDLEASESDADNVVSLASDARVRNVTFIFESVPPASNPFQIEFVTPSGSENWQVAVFQSGGGWDVTVTSTGGYSATCTRSGTTDDMAVDLSAATIDGDPCPALEGVAPSTHTYDVRLMGELNVDGRFWVTVDDLNAGKRSQYRTYSNTEIADVIYSAKVPFRYESSSVSYRTDLRTAPGEIR